MKGHIGKIKIDVTRDDLAGVKVKNKKIKLYLHEFIFQEPCKNKKGK